MIRRTWIARLFVAAVAAVAVAGSSARAGLLPVSVSVQPEAGNFRWTYAVVLPTDMKLQSGDYFTIYDFGGFTGAAGVSSAGPDDSFLAHWSFTSTNLGPTPERLNPQDDPNIPNLTFKYNGPTIPSGQIGLGNFWATSTFESTADSWFTGINPRSLDGAIDRNITETLVPLGTTPTPTPGVPEPTTLALAGLGLPLVALGRALRKKE